MLNNVKHTFRHTLIYSLGNISTKLIGVILLPLYFQKITPHDYGIFGILEATIFLLTQGLAMGLPNAVMRFLNIEKYQDHKNTTFFTLSIFTGIVALVFWMIGQLSSAWLGSRFEEPLLFEFLFRLTFSIIALRILNNLFLSQLRAEDKSITFAILNILKLTLILSLNIYFIANQNLGIKGIMLAYIIGDGFMLVLLLPMVIKYLKPTFDRKILNAALAFGFPLIFGGMAHMFLNIGNRYILKYLISYEEVGYFGMAYKIAGVINVLLIQSFQMGLLPLAYRLYGQPGDKRYYMKMMTYFMFVLFFCSLGLVFFFEDALRLFADETSEYWQALPVIPLLVLGFVMSGAKIPINVGLVVKGKTKMIAWNTVGAVIINIAFNFILIPHFRMYGAALANLIAFSALYAANYFCAQKSYSIPYENIKLLKMLIVALGLFMLSQMMQIDNLALSLLYKFGLLLAFPIILTILKFYEPIEIDRIRGFLKKYLKINTWNQK